MNDANALMKSQMFWALEVLQINRLFRFANRGRIKVLMFHSVLDVGHSTTLSRFANSSACSITFKPTATSFA